MHAAEVTVGARVLTNRGVVRVTRLDRHGVDTTNAAGDVRFVTFRDLDARVVVNGHVQQAHASLRPWWDGLRDDVRAAALFKLEVVQEILTGYREGLAAFASEGEPVAPFGPNYGASLSKRIDVMARSISFERSVDRAVMRRVRDGEIQSSTVAPRSILTWVRAWERDGLRGLVDRRQIRGKIGFDTLDRAFLEAADAVFATFNGDVSAVNLNEIDRRIRVRLKQQGVTDYRSPQRLTQEYLSFRHKQLGRTTRGHSSQAQRRVSGHASYPAQHPSECCTDVTRADNLVWDEVDHVAIGVEVATLMSLSTRVVLACRIFPRSANAVEIGLLLYDAMRDFSMVVEGTSADDFRWSGIPESLDLGANPVRLSRRPALKKDAGISGVHPLPGVTPSAIRCDHGSIYVSAHFRALLNDFGITLMLSRGKKPTDNPHVERLHETYQRAYQQIPGYKGRAVYERGRWVGIQADEPLLSAAELERHMHRFIAWDYHRQPHRGLVLPGAPTARLTPLEMWDALMDATGRISVPCHPDLLYQFLPVRWLSVGHAGVTYRNLTYDAPVLDEFRAVVPGRFTDHDARVPFHYDPRDVTRLWFRHPDTGRIHEIGWRARHLCDAPLTDAVRDRALERIRERGGNRALNRTVVAREIVEEITEISAVPAAPAMASTMAAARLRYAQSRAEHDEAADAHRVVQEQQAAELPRIPRASPPDPEPGPADPEPWPDYDAAGY